MKYIAIIVTGLILIPQVLFASSVVVYDKNTGEILNVIEDATVDVDNNEITGSNGSMKGVKWNNVDYEEVTDIKQARKHDKKKDIPKGLLKGKKDVRKPIRKRIDELEDKYNTLIQTLIGLGVISGAVGAGLKIKGGKNK